MDVRIQADVVFKSVDGHVEVQKGNDLVSVRPQSKLLEPVEIQTFEKGHVRFSVNSVYIGVDGKSYVLCQEKPECRLFWGTFFVKVPPRDAEWFLLKTPHGDFNTRGGEFLVTVNKAKTAATVVKGALEIKDRSSEFSQSLRPGYSMWIGGLTSKGRRARGDMQAASLDEVLRKMKLLGPYDGEEFKSKHDEFRPVWREAVDTVAREAQDQIAGEMQLLNEIKAVEARKLARQQSETRYLKKLFRARANGVLDQNTTGPSESLRAPSNVGQSEDTEYSDTGE
jgi:hypothetical protein